MVDTDKIVPPTDNTHLDFSFIISKEGELASGVSESAKCDTEQYMQILGEAAKNN